MEVARTDSYAVVAGYAAGVVLIALIVCLFYHRKLKRRVQTVHLDDLRQRVDSTHGFYHRENLLHRHHHHHQHLHHHYQHQHQHQHQFPHHNNNHDHSHNHSHQHYDYAQHSDHRHHHHHLQLQQHQQQQEQEQEQEQEEEQEQEQQQHHRHRYQEQRNQKDDIQSLRYRLVGSASPTSDCEAEQICTEQASSSQDSV